MVDLSSDAFTGGGGGAPGPSGMAKAPTGSGQFVSSSEFTKGIPTKEAAATGSGDEPGVGESIGAGLVSGVPFGAQLSAGVESALGYGSYSDRLAAIRGKISAAQEAHPWVTGAASLAPAAVMPFGAGSVGEAALYGAGYGAAYGAGEGEDLGDAANKALWGAGMGAIGGAGGAKAGQMIGSAFSGNAGRKVILDAAAKEGVPMARFMVGSPLEQRLGKNIQSVPVVGDMVNKATEKTLEGLGQAQERAAGRAGQADPYTSGETMHAAVKDWIGNTSKNDVDQAYNAVNQAMTNPNARTQLDNLRLAVTGINGDRSEARMAPSRAVGLVQNALDDPNGLTFQGIKKLRSSIGEMTDPANILPADMDGGELNQIYKGLSRDLDQSVINGGGQNALNAYRSANALYSDVQQNRAKLAKIIGGPRATASPEAVFNYMQRAAKKDTGNIDLLRLAQSKVDPAAWDELASGMVGKLGRDPSGGFTFDRFVKDYGNIGDDAKDVLFGASQSGSQLRDSLDNIHAISEQMKHLNIYASTHGASHAIGMWALLEHLPHIIAHPIKGGAGLVGGLAFGKYLTNPVTAQATAGYMGALRNYATNQTSPALRQGLAAASRRMAAAANAQFGANFAPLDFVNGLGLGGG
jgi:hypothetical protein